MSDDLADGTGAGTGQSTGQSAGLSTGGDVPGTAGGPAAPSVGAQGLVLSAARFRRRFGDVPDARWAVVVAALQVPESLSSIARGLVEEGYAAHLHPTTIRIYLMRFRDAMGWPKYADAQAEEPPARIDTADATGELIEGMPPLKRLAWLIRVQQARVRKALRFENDLGNLVTPAARDEVKLLAEMLGMEIKAARKTGAWKPVPAPLALQPGEAPITDPASAYRVALALRRVRAALLAENAAPGGEPGHPALAGAAARDGRADAGGGDAEGPDPGADGGHGRP